jgi:ankyrin repeat protein
MPDPTGHTAMTLAARLGRLSFIRALLSRGADPNGAMLRQGCVATNVIFFFLQGGGGSLRNSCWIDFAYRHLIYLLCSRFSIWIFANKKKKKKKKHRDVSGVSLSIPALHFASASGWVSCVRMLLAHGARVQERSDYVFE